jgi:hypothetical protein
MVGTQLSRQNTANEVAKFYGKFGVVDLQAGDWRLA